MSFSSIFKVSSRSTIHPIPWSNDLQLSPHALDSPSTGSAFSLSEKRNYQTKKPPTTNISSEPLAPAGLAVLLFLENNMIFLRQLVLISRINVIFVLWFSGISVFVFFSRATWAFFLVTFHFIFCGREWGLLLFCSSAGLVGRFRVAKFRFRCSHFSAGFQICVA